MSPIRMSKIESSMRIVLEFNEAFIRHDVAGMMKLMSDDCVFDNTTPAPDGTVYSGKEAVTQFLLDFFRESPQAHTGLDKLHTIDPETGISRGFVSHEFGSLNGLEFVDAILYGTFVFGPGNPLELVTVDTASGALTHIGATGFGPISGLAYDKGAGIMYGITAGGTPANLVRINLTTGAATVVGSTGLDRVGSIEFGPDGNLFGGVTAFGSSFPSYLVRINTATRCSYTHRQHGIFDYGAYRLSGRSRDYL